MPTDSQYPNRADLETAFDVALSDAFKYDCVHATFDSPKGEFTVEFGNFSDGQMFNVAGFSADHTPEDFTPYTSLPVEDEGPNFVVFEADPVGSGDLLADTLELVSGLDADLVGVKLRHIENLPSWWPDFLTP